MEIKKVWLRGGLIGLLMPLILLGFFFILNRFNIAFGGNPVTALLIFAMALIELPIATVGRLLGLPVESGGAAFIVYNFTTLGYILTIMFWVLAGMVFGWLIDRRNLNKK